MTIISLPRLMVAPNGARRTKADHPALPVTIEETVAAALSCRDAGAGGLHAHVRDRHGRHVLDAGLYRELIAEMAGLVPEMQVQITTEAVGRYTPEEQQKVVRAVEPAMVSVAVAEMIPDQSYNHAARKFYHWAYEAGIAVQHIVYSPEQLHELAGHVATGIIPDRHLQALFVLGRYSEGQHSNPSGIALFLEVIEERLSSVDWAVCAFGPEETDCLLAAYRAGGKARCGFENSLWNRDGSVAKDNAERISEVVRLDGIERGPVSG